MEANLIRHGYNIERRKMYVQNPRHNLNSTIDIEWTQSLVERKNNIDERKRQSSEQVKKHYSNHINKKIEEEAKLNKSSFRVMPISSKYSSPKYKDSLHNELDNYQESKKSQLEYFGRHAAQKQVHKKQQLSKTVFGYEISPDSFRKQSYLSMVLGDRLDSLIPKQKPQSLHSSLAINHPVPLKY